MSIGLTMSITNPLLVVVLGLVVLDVETPPVDTRMSRCGWPLNGKTREGSSSSEDNKLFYTRNNNFCKAKFQA